LIALHCAVLLPNADEAVIEPAKLRDYLLSTTHPLGRFKARFLGAPRAGETAPRFVTAYPGDRQ